MDDLLKEAQNFEKTKTELETHIDTLIRNRERYEEKVNVSKTNKLQEMAETERKHAAEVDRSVTTHHQATRWQQQRMHLTHNPCQKYVKTHSDNKRIGTL